MRRAEYVRLESHEGIAVYLDESLKAFDTVYLAAGDDHSAVKLTIAELEQV